MLRRKKRALEKNKELFYTGAVIGLLGVFGSGGYGIYRKLRSLSNDGRGEISALRVPQGKSSDALGKVPTIKRDGVENGKRTTAVNSHREAFSEMSQEKKIHQKTNSSNCTHYL